MSTETTHMRVAIFFDGKNFYSGWKDRTDGRRIDFEKMAEWIVREAGGRDLWGAYYYTAVETGVEAQNDGQRKLAAFLDERELDRGYFVKRFPRKAFTISCKACGASDRIFQEKEVDTTMVADMLTLAAGNAFDIAVLVSGDADHAPAVEGVRLLGKKMFVATWAGYGLSPRIRRAAFHHIDLAKGLHEFGLTAADAAPDAASQAARFPGGAAGLAGAVFSGHAERLASLAGHAAAQAAAAPEAATPVALTPQAQMPATEVLDVVGHGHRHEHDHAGAADAAGIAGGPMTSLPEDDFSAGIDPEPGAGEASCAALAQEAGAASAYAGPGTPGAFTVALQAQEASPARDPWTEATDQAPRLDAQGALFLDELVRALEKFKGGYVGLNFFLTRWKSPRMDAAPDGRRKILDGLKDAGFVEVYDSPHDRSKALRLGPRATAIQGAPR